MKLALTPTKIYVKNILALMAQRKFGVKGLAHITGSGFLNIPRISGKFDYQIERLPKRPEIFDVLQKRAGLDDKEMFTTFNCGLGFVVAVKKGAGEAVAKFLQKRGEAALVIGSVRKGRGLVEVKTANGKVVLS